MYQEHNFSFHFVYAFDNQQSRPLPSINPRGETTPDFKRRRSAPMLTHKVRKQQRKRPQCHDKGV
jgi:hypothetical protein